MVPTAVVATPALPNETTSLVETPLKLAEVNERFPGFLPEIARVRKGRGQEQLRGRKPMNLERLPCSHHGGSWRKRRARRDACPCRIGTIDMSEGQLAHTEFVLNLAAFRPSGRQPGQPRQGRGRLPRGHVALRLLPVCP